MKRRFEPFWWSLFGAGGAISALLLPVLIIIFGLAIPLGMIQAPSHEMLSGAISNWFVRLIAVGIISLSMFHWAHRFRFTLEEGLQLKAYDKIIAFICYGTAIGITVFAIFSLLI